MWILTTKTYKWRLLRSRAMEKQTLGKIEYESVSHDAVLERLNGVPEIEVTRVYVPDWKDPGYLMPDGKLRGVKGWLPNEMHTQLQYRYLERFGKVIGVKRRSVPVTKRVLQAVGIGEVEPSQQIEDLIQFLYDKIEIETPVSLLRLEKDNDRNFPSRLTYLEKIGDFKEETRLEIHKEECADPDLYEDEEGVRTRHIVRPTFVMLAHNLADYLPDWL